MFDKSRKYSYAAQKKQRRRKRWFFLWLFIFFILHTILTTFIFSFRVLENETMQPGLQRGDRFVFSSYRVNSFFPGRSNLLRRGNIVLIDKTIGSDHNFFYLTMDKILRFFTAQRFGLGQREGEQFIKRVIGLPGDEINMNNFLVRVRPSGEMHSFTEFELWDRPYESIYPSIPAIWDDSLPFSGIMETIIVGPNECFVLSDDRSNTNDSRTWGPIPLSMISGKALFRYWPFPRLGVP